MVVGSFLEHCSIRHAQYGVRATGLTSLRLSNCVVEDISTRGIEASLLDMQFMHIDQCTIQRVSGEGIFTKTETSSRHALSLRVTNSNISESVFVESYIAHVFLEGCNIASTDSYLVRVKSDGGQILVDKCRITRLGNGYALHFMSFGYQNNALNKVRLLLSLTKYTNCYQGQSKNRSCLSFCAVLRERVHVSMWFFLALRSLFADVCVRARSRVREYVCVVCMWVSNCR